MNKILENIKDDGVKRSLLAEGQDVLSPYNLNKHLEEFLSSFISKEYKEEFLDRYRVVKQLVGEDYYEWYNYNCTCIKDRNKALMITSFILLERETWHNICYANAYSYDATNSGYQILAILFKSKSLGRLCNLTGTDKQDIYQENINQKFNTYFKGCQDLFWLTSKHVRHLFLPLNANLLLS